MNRQGLVRLGLLLIGMALGATAVSLWPRTGTTGEEASHPRVASNKLAPAAPPGESRQETTAACDPPEGVASEQAAHPESNPATIEDTCPPILQTGLVDPDTPWERIAITPPEALLRSPGKTGLTLFKALGSTLSSKSATEGFRECGAHLRPPAGSKLLRYKADYVLDIESTNGEVRIVGTSVEGATYSDFQAERCFSDVFRMNDIIALGDAAPPEQNYRVRFAWPVVFRVSNRAP